VVSRIRWDIRGWHGPCNENPVPFLQERSMTTELARTLKLVFQNGRFVAKNAFGTICFLSEDRRQVQVWIEEQIRMSKLQEPVRSLASLLQ